MISQLDPQFLLDERDAIPGSVVRLPNGTIDHINDPFLNLASVRVDFVDFGGSYVTKEFGWGKLNAQVDATWYYHIMQQNQPGAPLVNMTDAFSLPTLR